MLMIPKRYFQKLWLYTFLRDGKCSFFSMVFDLFTHFYFAFMSSNVFSFSFTCLGPLIHRYVDFLDTLCCLKNPIWYICCCVPTYMQSVYLIWISCPRTIAFLIQKFSRLRCNTSKHCSTMQSSEPIYLSFSVTQSGRPPMYKIELEVVKVQSKSMEDSRTDS